MELGRFAAEQSSFEHDQIFRLWTTLQQPKKIDDLQTFQPKFSIRHIEQSSEHSDFQELRIALEKSKNFQNLF